MDAALQELGAGAKPADRPVWGAARSVSIKGKAGTSHFLKHVPAQSYSIGISSIDRIFQPYSGGRVWAEHTERFSTANA